MVLGQTQQLGKDQKRRGGSGTNVAILDGGAYRAHSVALRFFQQGEQSAQQIGEIFAAFVKFHGPGSL